MRGLDNIKESYNTVKGWDYSDVDEERDQDAQWAAGARAAFNAVLKFEDLPEAEREQKVLELQTDSLKYQSYGDDCLDAYHFGYQQTLVYCLNRISRKPYTIDELHTEYDNHDHDFKWHGKSDDKGNYLYECPHCDLKVI